MSAQRERKENIVGQMHDLFQEAKIIVVAHYDGSSVEQLSAMRDELAEMGGRFQITKNKLALRAVSGTPAEPLKALFSGPTAIATAHDLANAPKVPKIIVEFGKSHERIRIVGGLMDGQLLDADGVKNLANLPSMDGLRAKLIGLMIAPATKFMNILNQPASGMARLLAARPAQNE